MAKLAQEDILAYLEEATILELNELVKAIEEKFGVTAAAPVAVAAVADHGELYKLYVLPENRKKGIAEQFVLYLIKKIAVSNKDALFVEMTNQSIPFWERLIQKNDVSFEQYEGQLKIELWIN